MLLDVLQGAPTQLAQIDPAASCALCSATSFTHFLRMVQDPPELEPLAMWGIAAEEAFAEPYSSRPRELNQIPQLLQQFHHHAPYPRPTIEVTGSPHQLTDQHVDAEKMGNLGLQTTSLSPSPASTSESQATRESRDSFLESVTYLEPSCIHFDKEAQRALRRARHEWRAAKAEMVASASALELGSGMGAVGSAAVTGGEALCCSCSCSEASSRALHTARRVLEGAAEGAAAANCRLTRDLLHSRRVRRAEPHYHSFLQDDSRLRRDVCYSDVQDRRFSERFSDPDACQLVVNSDSVGEIQGATMISKQAQRHRHLSEWTSPHVLAISTDELPNGHGASVASPPCTQPFHNPAQ